MNRRLAGSIMIAFLLVCTVLFGAYGYRPAESGRSHQPLFLGQDHSRQVNTPIARFHYVRMGSGSPVVLLSPGMTSVIGWQQQARTLARSHTVYVVDLPGQGYTTVNDPDFDYDLDAMTGAIGSFLDAVGISRTALAGNSWSGGWALAYAQRNPDRVTRLALLDPTGLDLPGSPLWEMIKLPVLGELIVKTSSSKAIARSQLEQLLVHDELITDQLVEEWWAPLTFHDNIQATYRLQRRLDWSVTERAMPTTRTPTIVIWGAQDHLQPVDRARRFGDLLPDAQVAVLPGCGHAPQLDCPAEVNPLLDGFLAEA